MSKSTHKWYKIWFCIILSFFEFAGQLGPLRAISLQIAVNNNTTVLVLNFGSLRLSPSVRNGSTIVQKQCKVSHRVAFRTDEHDAVSL